VTIARTSATFATPTLSRIDEVLHEMKIAIAGKTMRADFSKVLNSLLVLSI
jgi:hypothetical protein